MKRLFAIITGLAVATVLIVPSPAAALTADELQVQINALLAQLSALQAQLSDLGGSTGGTVAGCTITSFTRNLSVGMTGDDVKCLQIVLNSSSDTKLASSGAGSPGNETSYFGPITKAGVVKFQEKYASEVLASYGLTSGTGYVGTTTRAKLNTLLAAGDGGVVIPPVIVPPDGPAGSLTVTLASDTPASASVADAANANFTKIRLTASSSGAVKISRLYVERSGLSANASVQNIKLIDVLTGEYVGDIGSLNTNNKASISFVPKLVIPAGQTKEYYIRAGIVNGSQNGETVRLGITSAADITSDADSVAGSFPITGNPMTVVTLTIGSLDVTEITLTDSQPNVGDTDIDVSEFKLAAGATENVTVETITVKEVGTADTSDTVNIELYDVTNGVSLGTVDNWSSDSKATWNNLNLNIEKGKNIRLKVRVDVVAGVSSTPKTIDVDLVDGTDALVVVKGNTYGFYITPGRSGSWDGIGTTQTIQAGALSINKSASTPATGNISAGSDIPLAIFDFDAKGEDIKITGITVTLTLGGGFANSDVTNVKLYDEDGSIVAGPSDLTAGDAAYTDTFIVPVGIHKYTVKATVVDSADAGNTVVADISLPGTTTVLVATGMTSGDTITATPAGDVAANTLTVAAGDLNVTTLADPATRSVPSPISAFVWATFSFDASASGEDVRVTAITVTDSLGGSATSAAVSNSALWADLTSANSTRGDVYETKISNSSAWTALTKAYSLNQTLVIPSGSFKKVALVADLLSGETGSHTFSVASGVTATGATSAETVTPDYTTTSKQTMAVSTSTLTVSVDASSPSAGLVIGGAQKVTLGVFKLAASNVQSLDLDSITLTSSNGTYVNTFYFYDGDTLLQAMPGANSIYVPFTDGTVTIPANGDKKITVKADLLPVDGTTIANGGALRVSLSGASNVVTTGLGSGSSVTSGAELSSNIMYLYKSRPYFAVNSGSPSGNLNPSSNTLLAIFDVTADAGDDITFDDDDSNILDVQIDATVADTALGYVTLTLKDQDGNTLGIDSVNVGPTGLMDGESATFNLSNAFGGDDNGTTTYSWTIPAGQTKKLYVYGNTSDFEDDGDFIQAWLSDDNAANCSFSVDSGTTNAQGTYIFKGDIYAGSFVNPS